MITVTLYLRENCKGCKQAEQDLAELQEVIPHVLVRVDVTQDPSFRDVKEEDLPILLVGPYRLQSTFNRQEIEVALRAAQDRSNSLELLGTKAHRERVARGQTLSVADKISYAIAHHYMAIFNLLVFLYVGLPFLAPVLMEKNAELPANIIYTIYRPLCHELAFRSYFLFGEQAYYPRDLAGMQKVRSYEQATGLESTNVIEAQQFKGNPQLGYKVALCERDIAIYGSFLLFGLIFAITGRRIKPFRGFIFFWLLVGVLPIALDGFSQLPNLAGNGGLTWLPNRESTPILRTITGALFGFTTAWYIYPMMEVTMQETRQMLAQKMAVIRQIKNKA